MAKISGVLTDGAGNIINNCTIELCAKKTTHSVLTQTQAFIVADDGKYEINASPCEYYVTLIINGFPPKKLGAIQIFSDSVDGTLNDFLLNPTEDEVTPAILQQVFEARNETNKSANRAVESEKKIKFSENNALESSKLAKTSADNAKNSSDLANQSATNAKNSAQQSADNVIATKSSADAAKTYEQSAKKSADDAKNAASSIDTTGFIKKSGVDNQSIDGSLDVKNLTENGQHVYSPNNKPTADDIGTVPAVKKQVNGAPIYVVGDHVVFRDIIGDQRLMPFRHDKLPFGWYFRNGDNYLLNSPQGQVLNGLSADYKNDHRITIKTINGQQFINVPTAFAPDGRGFFIRAVDGATRQVGHIEDDAIRDIYGHFDAGVVDHHDVYARGAFRGSAAIYPENGSAPPQKNWAAWGYDFRASNVVPTANENRVLNIGATPAIYLGV